MLSRDSHKKIGKSLLTLVYSLKLLFVFQYILVHTIIPLFPGSKANNLPNITMLIDGRTPKSYHLTTIAVLTFIKINRKIRFNVMYLTNCDSRIMVLKDIHILILGTRNITLHDKRDFADVVKSLEKEILLLVP